MSHTRILIHYVFRTKQSAAMLRAPVFEHAERIMHGICSHLGLNILACGGMEDHLHLLVEQPPALSVSDVAKKLKSNSSRMLNRSSEIHTHRRRFAWGRRFGAFSVSPGNADRVVAYIRNQAEHHRRMSSAEEFAELLRLCGITPMSEIIGCERGI